MLPIYLRSEIQLCQLKEKNASYGNALDATLNIYVVLLNKSVRFIQIVSNAKWQVELTQMKQH